MASGTLRGLFDIGTIPADVHVTGQFGSHSNVHIADSAPVDHVTLEVTGSVNVQPASGLISVTGIPATMDFDVLGFGSGTGINVPTVTYTASDSTLGGLFQVDAKLAAHVGPGGIGTNGVFLQFTNLGAMTTVKVSTSAVTIASNPPTAKLLIGGNLQIPAIPQQSINKDLFSDPTGFFTGNLSGTFGLGASSIDDLEVEAHSISSLTILPGRPPLGLPTAVGFLFPGVLGSYGRLTLTANGVNLNPNVNLLFKIDRTVGPDAFDQSLVLSHTGTILFHHYDNFGPGPIDTNFQVLALVNLFCVSVSTNPEPIGQTTNGITLTGSGGPQTFTFLDPGGNVPSYIINLAAWLTSPFPNPTLNASFSAGSC